MATATGKTKKFDHEGTQKRVRSPLQVVRKYIRRYVILEGLALFLLFGSLVFWLGLAFDFGLASLDFSHLAQGVGRAVPDDAPAWIINREDPNEPGFIDLVGAIDLHGVDWIQEVNEIDTTSISSRGVRFVVLMVLIIGFLALGLLKVGLRWMREFNDRAVALVLERRFPKELGDRLITAIELADPKLAKKYGFSQVMLEKTIAEAAATMKKLPIASVFNWRRLFGLWFLAALTTFGVLLFNVIVFWIGSALFAKDTVIHPGGFSWRFYDTAAIWTERNVLMMNTYWPRRAHLEVVRFQPSKEEGKQNEMRVAKDDTRPELQVRAIVWVIADRSEPSGWRALKWHDLSERNLVDDALLKEVQIPTNFPDWKIDPEELEPNLVVSLFGTDTQARRSADIRAHFDKKDIAQKINERKEKANLDYWLDWHNWSMDKLANQKAGAHSLTPLGKLRGGKDLANLNAVFNQLEEHADDFMMSRTLRKLEPPPQVDVNFRGAETSARERPQGDDGKYTVSLESLKDSTRFRFRARAEDFYTSPKWIVLVPAPQPEKITIDKEEPAYIYHRLWGADQEPLRDRMHVTRGTELSRTGDTNSVDVPLGTNLVIHVRSDRKLHSEKGVFTKESAPPGGLEPTYTNYAGSPPVIDSDYLGFKLNVKKVAENQDFMVEFFDEDNIRGKWRFRIQRTLDAEPQVGPLGVADVTFRKPRVPTVAKDPTDLEKDKEADKELRVMGENSELMNSYMITPDAYIPLECTVEDDYGLMRAGYHYKVRKVNFDLISLAAKKASPVDITKRVYYAKVLLSSLQFRPDNPLALRFGPHHFAMSSKLLLDQLRETEGYREANLPSEAFDALLERERLHGRMASLELIKQNIEPGTRDKKKEFIPRSMKFEFRDERDGFDVQKYLKDLKNLDADKVQGHYQLQIAVYASDNNIMTGETYPDEKGVERRGNTRKNKNGYLSFVVVSENELLAQIALEEADLSEKLEKAHKTLEEARDSLQAQRDKVKDWTKDDSTETLNFRMNEIRTAISSVGADIRFTVQAYSNIDNEMRYNRVRSDRRDTINDKIHKPLRRILEGAGKVQGSHPDAEDTFQKAIALVEADHGASRKPDYKQHKPLMDDAEQKIETLRLELNGVLIAMSTGLTLDKAKAMLHEVERRHKQEMAIIKDIHEKAILELFEPEKKPMPDKKTSSNSGLLDSDAGFWARRDVAFEVARAEQAFAARLRWLAVEQPRRRAADAARQ